MNEDEVKKLYEQMYDEKLMDLFKSTFTLKEKKVSYDEFVKLASGKSSKFNLLDKLKF